MANKIISFGDVWSKKVLVLLGVPIFCVIRTMLVFKLAHFLFVV